MAWCALSDAGKIVGEGAVAANEDGFAGLVIKCGREVRAVMEMISGAIWVRDTLAAAGWEVQIAHARKVRDVAPLACKTDKVDGGWRTRRHRPARAARRARGLAAARSLKRLT